MGGSFKGACTIKVQNLGCCDKVSFSTNFDNSETASPVKEFNLSYHSTDMMACMAAFISCGLGQAACGSFKRGLGLI